MIVGTYESHADQFEVFVGSGEANLISYLLTKILMPLNPGLRVEGYTGDGSN